MNYPFLKLGDRLPTVGVLQKLLNASGEHLEVDGVFGNKTHTSVRKFQLTNNLQIDGQVGGKTWAWLVSNFTLPIVDFVDVFDYNTMQYDLAAIRTAGGTPLTMGGVCNGVEQMVTTISASQNNIFLLRFTDHGNAGIAGMGFGDGVLTIKAADGTNNEIDVWGENSDIDNNNLSVLRPILERLRPVFGPYGCVQFMGCNTGSGHEGKKFLESMADILNVPVSAAVNIQYGNTNHYPLAFQGPTNTAVPQDATLKSWCESRSEFTGGICKITLEQE